MPSIVNLATQRESERYASAGGNEQFIRRED
jgi:hypothetical protein